MNEKSNLYLDGLLTTIYIKIKN